MVLNKRKIVNDPVYGFINIPFPILFDLIEHPYFQRLRRIQQLGLTNMVYPGGNHTRFQHALGAMHLMEQAIAVLRSKGHEITETEAEAVMIAILLHDIGHGPFSHALESTIVDNTSHEILSLLFMQELNDIFGGRLQLAIDIFQDKYPKHFLYQLVSSQLDMDRLDYLRRDSFFTGVIEGAIGSDRIIKMLDVVNDELVVEEKGIYSIEKFLLARRVMYWQVYFHKTVISAENLLLNILQRVKYLARNGEPVFATPCFEFFIANPIPAIRPESITPTNRKILLDNYSKLEDNDIFSSAKVWADSNDKVLSLLSSNLMSRRLYRIEMQYQPFEQEYIDKIGEKILFQNRFDKKDLRYFAFTGTISNYAYSLNDDKIKIMKKTRETMDIAEASDMLNLTVLSKQVVKHYLCYLKTM
jgi:HD superfamily phosphohydrolase